MKQANQGSPRPKAKDDSFIIRDTFWFDWKEKREKKSNMEHMLLI